MTHDDDAPILTPEMMRRARPAKDAFSEKARAAFKRPPSRPKAGGPGWQSRINDVLVEAARRG